MAEQTQTSFAFIAVVGRPNVGKSSLLNALIGYKVAIVSQKPQTTRNRITGILTDGGVQLAFLDTPGNHRPRTGLGEYMVKTIGEAVSGVDAGVLVVEPTKSATAAEDDLLEQFRRRKLPAVLVINKIDTLADKQALLEVIAYWQTRYDFVTVFPVSALTGDGVDELREELKKFAEPSPHYFPDDIISDQPDRVLAAEILREKALLLLRDEVPHGIAVTVESMEEGETARGAILDIEATICCEKESHKGMVIGKGGRMLREIGSAARQELEEWFDIPVNLQCHVKVREGWRNRRGQLTNFGYSE